MVNDKGTEAPHAGFDNFATLRVLPQGTAYITDVGMTGPHEGVIGRKKEQILTRFITQLPTRFEMAEEDIRLNGALIEVDDTTGKAVSIKRVSERL